MKPVPQVLIDRSPTAPIQRNGNVYTLTGNITSDADGIVVERNKTVVDGSGFAVEGSGEDYGICLEGRSNVTIQNTNVRYFGYGIWLGSSSYNSDRSMTLQIILFIITTSSIAHLKFPVIW